MIETYLVAFLGPTLSLMLGILSCIVIFFMILITLIKIMERA